MGINFDNYTKLPFNQEYGLYPMYDLGGITNTFFPAGAPISGRELNEVQERLQSQFYSLAQSIALLASGVVNKHMSRVALHNDFAFILFLNKKNDANDYCYGISFNIAYLHHKGKIYRIPDKTIGTESIPIEPGPIYIELSKEIDVGINGNTQLYEQGLHSIIIGGETVYSGNLMSCDEYFKEDFVDNDGAESVISARKVRNIIIRVGGKAEASIDEYTIIKLGDITRDGNVIEFTPSNNVVYFDDLFSKTNNHTHQDIKLTVSPNEFELAQDESYQYSKNLQDLDVTISVENPIVSIDSKQLNIDNYESMQEAFSCIDKAIVEDNVLTLTCFSQKPEADIPIIIKVV